MNIEGNKFGKYAIPCAILLLNLILKSIFLTSRDIALDEPFSIFYGQMNLHSIVDMLYNENNPPLHFFILHFFIKFGGIDALTVRLPSLIFSALTSVFIFRIGERFFKRTIAVGASLVYTFSTMHIFFSHEARVYPLFVLLTVCSLYYFMRIVETPSDKKNYAYLFLCNLLLIYAHYFGFFVLFVEVVSLSVISNRSLVWKKLFIVMIAVGFCYLPILLIFFHRLGLSTGQGTWVSPPGVTELYGNLNRFLNNRYNTAVLGLLFVLAFFLLNQTKIVKEKVRSLFHNTYFNLTFIWFAIPYFIMFLVSFKYPMFIDRYILYTSIPFYLTVVIALDHFFVVPTFSKYAIMFMLISQLFTINLNPDNNRRLKELVNVTKSMKGPDTRTIIAPDYAYMGFCYHYDPEVFKMGHEALNALKRDNIFAVSSPVALAEVLNDAPSIIYIQAGTEFVDPQNVMLQTIQKLYKNHKIVHVFEIYDVHYFTN